MNFTILENRPPQKALDELSNVLLHDGLLRVLPASQLEQLDQAVLRFWCHENAVYCLPSLELIEWLRGRIGVRNAIEIGAGNGAIGRALGIPTTDSRMQARPEIAMYYALTGQPTIKYPNDIEELDAHAALEKYKPEVVIGSWITHKYLPERPELEGNQEGVDENALLERIETYIFIGAESVHGSKPLLEFPHSRHYPLWLFGRGKPPQNTEPRLPQDRFIGIWNNEKELTHEL